MLRSLKDLERYKVLATDGAIGSVANFLFDDEKWVLRYLVVETGGYFDGREVLISPISFRTIDWDNRAFHLGLSKLKVQQSPKPETDEPLSRQYERSYYRYYGHPYYWGDSGYWGSGAYPSQLAEDVWREPGGPLASASGDRHLRSVNEVRGYHIQGRDGELGHVQDFIVDEESWKVRYLVVDTSNWWIGSKKVLVSPDWATNVSWADQKVYIDLSRQAIKDSPVWNEDAAIQRKYETELYDFHGRPIYWNPSAPPKAKEIGV